MLACLGSTQADVRVKSTPADVRVKQRRVGLRVVAVAAALMTLAGGMTLATAPIASAVVACPAVDRTGSAPYPVTPIPTFGQDWSGCDLHGADLTVGTLFAAMLMGSNLAGAVMTGQNLNSAVFSNSNLTGALMSGADLRYATLTANLTGAQMLGADLSDANLYGANLSGANLSSANVNNATVADIFVNCGAGGILGTSITGTLSAYTPLSSGWTLVSGTLTAPNVACSGGGSVPAAPAAPPAPPLPAPQSLPPVAGVIPAAEVPAGASTGSVNGVPVVTTVTSNPAGGVRVAGGGSTVVVADLGADGRPLPATSGGLAGAAGAGLSVQATGFLPQSQADVYMYSEQLWLGKANVDAGGNVAMSLTIPSWVTPGGHTLQFVGYQGPYTSIVLSTGITVAPSAPQQSAAQSASARPVAGEFNARFLRGSAGLSPAAKAGMRGVVDGLAKGTAGATVACTATHLAPGTAQARALWARREAAVRALLTRAGCDTIAIDEGALSVVSGQPGLALRVTATAG